MNVVVSNNAKEYTGFIKVSKVQDLVSLKGKIDVLVLHKSNEPDDIVIQTLTSLKDSIGKMIYIREPDSCNKAIQMIVVGSGGNYFDDEFFLESGEDLKNLIDNLGEVYAIAELAGVNVVGEFFNRYLSEGNSNFTKEYLIMVKSAVSNMIQTYKEKDLELLQLSETATEIFANSATLIAKGEEERRNLQRAVLDLKESKEFQTIRAASNVSRAPSVLFFPKVSYPKSKDIIRIKEIGNFPYLTSFMLGFRRYLDQIKNVQTKLIFIYPVGEMYEEIYKDFQWVTQESSTTMSVYYNDVVCTNFPIGEVVTRLLDDKDRSTFIVVDRLKSSKDHILNCREVCPVRYAVSSRKYSEDYRLKNINCFFQKEVTGSLFSITNSENYPEEFEQRERFYIKNYASSYELLYSIKRG